MKMNEIVNEGIWAQTGDFMDIPNPPAVYTKYAQPHTQFPELKTIHGNLRELVANREDVRAMQAWLNQAGYEAGTEDGAWGPNTHNALATFNRAFTHAYARAKQQKNTANFFKVVNAAMFIANPGAYVANQIKGAAIDAVTDVASNALTGNNNT